MNIYAFVLVVIGLLWGLGVFFGFLTGISKSFKNDTAPTSSSAQKLRDKQHEIAEDAETKRKDLMEDIQQKMRDNQKY